MRMNRREMLAISGLGLVSVGLAGAFTGCAEDAAAPAASPSPSPGSKGWGPLTKAGDELALPEGFSYRTFGAVGTPMSDGLPTPGCHDGQGLFAAGNGRLRLIRNHEIDLDVPGTTQQAMAERMAYDRAAPAGCTSSLYDPAADRLLESFLVLNGTLTNCSGAATPWNSWLTCEETTAGTGAGFERPHGYVFEIPSEATGLITPVPIKAMGRFAHETAPIDPATGIAYMTEDNGEPGDGFYRFIPDHPGRLADGGKLQMLAIAGDKEYDTAKGQRVGDVLDTYWVDIDDPDPSDAEDFAGSVYAQGRAKGGARFLGLEGSSWADGGVTFVASEAGDAENGQVWRYEPTEHNTGTLRMLYESTDAKTLNQPDAITVAPNGTVILAEDGNGDDADGDNWLRVLTASGEIADLAQVIAPLDLHHWNAGDFPEPGPTGASEMSGPCFTPDGKQLFVNVQYPGTTCVISGPWG